MQDVGQVGQAQAVGAHASAGGASNKGKKKRKGGGIWRVVFWISLLVFVCAVGALGYIAWGYISADRGYKEVASQAFTVLDTKTSGQTTEAAPEPEAQGLGLGDLEVDWDYLRGVNPDIVAWVYVPGTRINYPVVQGKDNDEYLWTDFNRTSSRCGSVFLDAGNTGTFSDANNVLYGHHMNDGSMFADISNVLKYQEEFNTRRSVYVLTPSLNYKCQSFAVVVTDGWDLLVQTAFANEKERDTYVQDKIDRSVVQPEEGMPNLADVEKMFTLSTCDYSRDNGRAVLFTRVVDTAVPKSSPEGHAEVQEEDLSALEGGVAVAAD